MRVWKSGLITVLFGCLSAMAYDAQHTAYLTDPTGANLYFYGGHSGGVPAYVPYTSAGLPSGSSAIPSQCWNNKVGEAGNLQFLVFRFKVAYSRHACPTATDSTYVYPCWRSLRAYMVLPPNHRFDSTSVRPVAALFHGGSWQQGTPMEQLAMAFHLASLGVPAVAFQYRQASVDDRVQRLGYDDYLTREEATMDAKSAIRWLRKYAAHFSFDPNNIIAMGGSAGGHLALATTFSDPSISDESPALPESKISANANWFIPMFAVTMPTLVGLGGSDGTAVNPAARIPAPNISLARARLIDPYFNAGNAASTKGLMIVSGLQDVHPLTPVWSQIAMVNQYNVFNPGKGRLVELPGPLAIHDFISQPDSPSGFDGFESGMAFVDDFLIANGLMPNWSGLTDPSQRIRWFQYSMDPSYSATTVGYDRVLCGGLTGDARQLTRYGFNGYYANDPSSAVLTFFSGDAYYSLWNLSVGGLW